MAKMANHPNCNATKSHINPIPHTYKFYSTFTHRNHRQPTTMYRENKLFLSYYCPTVHIRRHHHCCSSCLLLLFFLYFANNIHFNNFRWCVVFFSPSFDNFAVALVKFTVIYGYSPSNALQRLHKQWQFDWFAWKQWTDFLTFHSKRSVCCVSLWIRLSVWISWIPLSVLSNGIYYIYFFKSVSI